MLGCVGVVLVAAGVLLATVKAEPEWVPPLELSVVQGHAGHTVASVQLGSAGPIAAQLVIVADERLLWSTSLSRETGRQNVVLPSRLLLPGSLVLVESHGQSLREVDG
jgi:hypothetical protein